jgi:hypothetical protein
MKSLFIGGPFHGQWKNHDDVIVRYIELPSFDMLRPSSKETDTINYPEGYYTLKDVAAHEAELDYLKVNNAYRRIDYRFSIMVDSRYDVWAVDKLLYQYLLLEFARKNGEKKVY